MMLAEFFSKDVWVTNHARERMQHRNIDVATLEHIIEEGQIKRRDAVNLWVFSHRQERADNLVCAAVVEQSALVVKTVMVNWELEDEA